MKLFSNFDTYLDEKLYQENVLKYGKDSVYMVYRDRIFFIIYILFPIVLLILDIAFLFSIGFFWNTEDDTLNSIKRVFVGFLSIVSIVVILFKVLKKYLDYKMDFALITPGEIIKYDQTGFFSRSSRTINASKIKTMTVSKKGILKSIFNFGTIVILSEGDSDANGDIELNHVHSPDQIKQIIHTILYKNKENIPIEKNK